MLTVYIETSIVSYLRQRPSGQVLTWNCRHIANANKFGHIRRVNDILGLGNPELVTPLELLNEDTING